MEQFKETLNIAIIGGGPSGLFMYKRIVETGNYRLKVTIYEKGDCLGCGMPYSHQGAADEHVTNVSGNEIPDLFTSVAEWIYTVPKDTLDKYNIDPEKFNDYKVLPRLLFGQYLNHQFGMLQMQAAKTGIETKVLFNSLVVDIVDQPKQNSVEVITENGSRTAYDKVIICSGHLWPTKNEGKTPGYFDSPYPPAKIAMHVNHTVAVRGASLTAIDAIRTLARHNGVFKKGDDGILRYTANSNSEDFKIVMHSRNGLLPAVRFHLEDTHLGKDTVLSDEEVQANRAKNNGFLSLDYVFEQNFKAGIRKNDPAYYQKIADMNMEAFVSMIMEQREGADPFNLLKAEYVEAEQSIAERKSVYWKEMLAILSFAMNYPAKYFSAEDMLRLQKTLMPLISVVIAFVPQSSAETLLALHQAGRLTMVTVDNKSEVIPQAEGGIIYKYVDEAGQNQEQYFQTFVDAIGQPHLAFEDMPYPSLLSNDTISKARLKFADPKQGQHMLQEGNRLVVKDVEDNYYLTVPGIAINDNFQILDKYNALNDRLYVMAVPFIGGYNPDYSGLDFSEAASAMIIERMFGTSLAKAS